ncbi:mechanosensitive ion channel [Candidatus Dojkabacteria bacterium]|nr:mechanosensitive ion channel [Candidatus Dojkabacteria bacterium]
MNKNEIQKIYDSMFFDWDYGVYLQSALIFILVYSILYLFRLSLERGLKRAAERTKFDLDDLIVEILDSFGLPFYFIVSLFAAVQVLDVGTDLNLWFKRIVFAAVLFYAVKAVNTLIRYSFRKYGEKTAKDSQDPTALKVLNSFIELVVWIVAALILMQNFGYNITTLLGGLGIAGIAVAFGLQNVLEDIFSFFTLYFDKPFKIGDFIVVGDDAGTVKRIGIKSTRIRTLQGQELVISNKELTGTRVNNYKKLKNRRIEFEFGVTYGTPHKKLEKIPSIVESVVSKIDAVEHDRTHLKEFGDSALVFETVFIVDDSSYDVYMDVRQQINLAMIKSFEKEKIEFAFPTQTVFVKN